MRKFRFRLEFHVRETRRRMCKKEGHCRASAAFWNRHQGIDSPVALKYFHPGWFSPRRYPFRARSLSLYLHLPPSATLVLSRALPLLVFVVVDCCHNHSSPCVTPGHVPDNPPSWHWFYNPSCRISRSCQTSTLDVLELLSTVTIYSSAAIGFTPFFFVPMSGLISSSTDIDVSEGSQWWNGREVVHNPRIESYYILVVLDFRLFFCIVSEDYLTDCPLIIVSKLVRLFLYIKFR